MLSVVFSAFVVVLGCVEFVVAVVSVLVVELVSVEPVASFEGWLNQIIAPTTSASASASRPSDVRVCLFIKKSPFQTLF